MDFSEGRFFLGIFYPPYVFCGSIVFVYKYIVWFFILIFQPYSLYKSSIFLLFTLKGDNLGNIRQTFIKNIALDLVEKYPNQFVADDFQHNKNKVAELSDVGSKLLRNRIAGYVTRHLASKNKGKSS